MSLLKFCSHSKCVNNLNTREDCCIHISTLPARLPREPEMRSGHDEGSS